MPVAHFRSASARGLRRRRIETATCTSSLRIRLLPYQIVVGAIGSNPCFNL
jgi:hypothetical protein